MDNRCRCCSRVMRPRTISRVSKKDPGICENCVILTRAFTPRKVVRA